MKNKLIDTTETA